MEYAIKYVNIKIDEETNILLPKEIIKGRVEGENFKTNKYAYNYITKSNINTKYLVGPSFTIEHMRNMYALPEEEFTNKQVLELILMEAQDTIIVYKNGKYAFLDLSSLITSSKKVELYQVIDGESCLFLNQDSVNNLLTIKTITELKDKLKFMRDKICKFATYSDNYDIEIFELADGVKSNIYMKEVFDEEDNQELLNDEVSSELDKLDDVNTKDDTFSDIKNMVTSTKETSVEGLYKYLKDNIIGHDEALKKIATILYMNYTSSPLFGTESILIPGPTGTGKTATFNCAAKYFDVPFRYINTCNLVPEGIVGTTLEDEFEALISECKGNMKLAEKAILVFDEFDKIGVDKLDTKTSLVNIFLKALEGGRFPISRQMKETQIYNTGMASKICLGTFQEAFKKETAPIGFGNNAPLEEEQFDKTLLVKKGYFTSELLTRFQHFIPYKNLSEEDKKKILLESKLSYYLAKKERLSVQFGIETIGDEEFAKGVLEEIKKHEKSVRDMNNIVADTFLDIEYDILSNQGKYKTLKLTRDTVSKGNYDLY